jgi:hypothetical protein
VTSGPHVAFGSIATENVLLTTSLLIHRSQK